MRNDSIEKNQREGAVFDQKWYGFRRFGEYQELFMAAERVLFYGGLEADVRAHIRGQYRSVIPLGEDEETGEIRVFAGRLMAASGIISSLGRTVEK